MHIYEGMDLIKVTYIKVWGLMCSNNNTMRLIIKGIVRARKSGGPNPFRIVKFVLSS